MGILKKDGIGVMPTDTIYALVGSALSKKAVERIYHVRKREKTKPFIVLISSLKDLKLFGVKVSKEHLKILKALWPLDVTRGKPGPVSVILPVRNKKFSYLHRGASAAGGSIAFRLPKSKKLINILKKTGPLVAPSANPAGKSPAFTIRKARIYFGDRVDFYVDRGVLRGEPSSIIEIKR